MAQSGSATWKCCSNDGTVNVQASSGNEAVLQASAVTSNSAGGIDIETTRVLFSEYLLQQMDARHEAFARRIEDAVQKALDRLGSAGALPAIPLAKQDGIYSKNFELTKTVQSGPTSNWAELVSDQANDRFEDVRVQFKEDDFIPIKETKVAEPAPQVTEVSTEEAEPAHIVPQLQKRSSVVDPTKESLFFSGQVACRVDLQILEAQGLLGSDYAWKKPKMSDPYARVVLCKRGEVFRTNTQKATVHPAWNETCMFEVSPDFSEFVVEVWDEDKMDNDDLLGRVHLNVSDLWQRALDGWFELSPQEDCPNAQGKVLLKANLKVFELTETMAYFRLQKWGDAVLDMTDNNEEPWAEPGHSPGIRKQDLSNWAKQNPALVSMLEGQQNYWMVSLRKIVLSKRFDTIFCGAIIFNAFVMLLELEYYGRKSQPSLGLAPPGSNSSEGMEKAFYGMNVVFTVVFVIELIFRATAFGKNWLKTPWSWLDIIIVGGSLLDVSGGSFVNLTFLRLIRLTKLTRLVKAAMMTNFCEPLRVLMKAIAQSFPSLVWSFVLLAMVEVVAALFMTQVLQDAILDEDQDLETRIFLYTYYGTTSRTVLTMFQITMSAGQWALVGRPVIENVSPIFGVFYVLYVGGVTFAVIRIIAALFLRQTMEVATRDERVMRNEAVLSKRRYSEAVRDLFIDSDEKGIGRVTFEQFQIFIKSDEGQDWLDELQLEDEDATAIFQLANDGAGALTIDEYLSAVFRLKDTTKQIDMLILQLEAKKNGKLMKKMLRELREVAKQIPGSSIPISAPADMGTSTSMPPSPKSISSNNRGPLSAPSMKPMKQTNVGNGLVAGSAPDEGVESVHHSADHYQHRSATAAHGLHERKSTRSHSAANIARTNTATGAAIYAA